MTNLRLLFPLAAALVLACGDSTAGSTDALPGSTSTGMPPTGDIQPDTPTTTDTSGVPTAPLSTTSITEAGTDSDSDSTPFSSTSGPGTTFDTTTSGSSTGTDSDSSTTTGLVDQHPIDVCTENGSPTDPPLSIQKCRECLTPIAESDECDIPYNFCFGEDVLDEDTDGIPLSCQDGLCCLQESDSGECFDGSGGPSRGEVMWILECAAGMGVECYDVCMPNG